MKSLIGIFTIFIVLMVMSGVFIYRVTANSMKDQLGDQCMGIATAISALIEQDIDGYLDFIENQDTESEYYRDIKPRLEKVRYTNDSNIRFLYTEIRISDDQIMYVLDGEYADEELFSPPGAIDQMTENERQAYESQTAYVGRTFSENTYGKLLNAYAPIHDRDGNFVGFVGVDVSAEQYDALMRYQLITIGTNIIFMTILMLVLSYALARVYKEKIQATQESKSKSSFLARMSHEIRTPMNAIMGMSELLLREQLPPAAREQAVSVQHASANLLAIINDILDFSKIESGRFELVEAPYLFSSLLNDIISIIRMKLTDKPILFTVDVDSRIPNELIGDEVRLRQILLNVLSNAVKYTDEGEVSIAITGTMHGEAKSRQVELTIRVSDTGIGINEDKLEELFDDFVRLDTTRNKNIEGTGLGLSITRALCTAMGGTIQASSRYGEGSVFTITLQQRFETYVRFAEVEVPEAKSILVYDTRCEYGTSVCAAAESLGIYCLAVDTQEEFREQLQKRDFSHVLAASSLYDQVRNMIRQLNPRGTLILLTDFGENVSKNDVNSLAMPIHSMSLANVLNGENEGLVYQERVNATTRFTAPNARVLIVDDVSTNLKVAEGLLAPFGMLIDCTLSGREAVRLVQQNHYDLVLMDHMMPEMDGIEATKQIRMLARENEYFENLPVIALTANAVSGMREMFLSHGLNDFLAKPIETEKLYQIMEKWIPKAKQEKVTEVSAAAVGDETEIVGLDINTGIARTGGRAEIYVEILEVFCRDSQKKDAEIRQCLKSGDWKLFTIYVHALKSALASIGALELSQLARTLEEAGNQVNETFIRERTTVFLQELAELTARIRGYLSRDDGDGEEGTGDEVQFLTTQLTALKQALADIDIRSADEAVEQLRSGCWTRNVQQKLEQVYDFILVFEYESAVRVIDQMMVMD